MRTRICLSLWTALLLCLAGCASPQRDPEIDVTLANVRFTGVTVTETTMEFTVRIENATPESLALQGGVFKLYLDGTYLGKGLSGDAVQVPRLSSTTVPVQLHLSNLRLASRIRSIVEGQKLDYRLESTVYLANGRHAGCLREGSLDLNAFQPTPTGR